ncbi:hypothetical protein ACFQ1I_08650 [Kitasatospora arboriphila]
MLVSPVVLYLIRSARELRAVDDSPQTVAADATPVPAGGAA